MPVLGGKSESDVETEAQEGNFPKVILQVNVWFHGCSFDCKVANAVSSAEDNGHWSYLKIIHIMEIR